MKITGENTIAAAKQEVWKGLNDPDVLKAAIPGCESLELVSENNFKATVITRIGPISARFEGTVELSDLDPPNGYKLSGSGSAGPMGNAKGSAVVRLTDVPEGTHLTYDVDANVTGKIAQLGNRLIQSTAGVLAGQFFNKFGQIVAGDNAGAQPAVTSSGGSMMKFLVAGACFIAVAIAAYYVFA